MLYDYLPQKTLGWNYQFYNVYLCVEIRLLKCIIYRIHNSLKRSSIFVGEGDSDLLVLHLVACRWYRRICISEGLQVPLCRNRPHPSTLPDDKQTNQILRLTSPRCQEQVGRCQIHDCLQKHNHGQVAGKCQISGLIHLAEVDLCGITRW